MSAKLHPNFPTALCRDKDRLRSFLLIFRIKGIVTVTLKSDGVALATVATKATANIIIIAQARAIGNQPAAGNQEQTCCGGELEPSYLLTPTGRGASQRPQRRYSATLRRTALAGRQSLRTPGAVPASSGGGEERRTKIQKCIL